MNHVEQTLSEIELKINTLVLLRNNLRIVFGMDSLAEPPPEPSKNKRSTKPQVESVTINLNDLPKVFRWENMVDPDSKVTKKLAQSRIAYWLKTGKIVRVDRGRYTAAGKELAAEFKTREVPKDIQEQIAASTKAMERAKESGNDALAMLHQNRINTLKGQ